MGNLSTAEMTAACAIFTDCFNHVRNSLSDETRVKVDGFVIQLVKEYRPYMLGGTLEGVARAIKEIFEVDYRHDFIRTLCFQFFSRWGNEDEAVMALAANLARSITLTGVTLPKGEGPSDLSSYQVIPNGISQRTKSVNEVTVLLGLNQWLIVVLMIQLLIDANDPVTGNARTRKTS